MSMQTYLCFRLWIKSETMLAIDAVELPNPKQHLSCGSLVMPRIFTAGRDALEAPPSMPESQV